MKLPQAKINGFTLIELLVVIAIIAILSIIGIVIFSNIQRDARDTKRVADINAIAKALEVNKTQDGTYVALDSSWFNGGIPFDPISGNLHPPFTQGCGDKTKTNQEGACWYCFKSSGGSPGIENGTPGICGPIDVLPDDIVTGTNRWVLCANLESNTPNFYCRGAQQ